MRVLLIEDDPGIVRMTEQWLGIEGHEVSSATDGETGAKMAREESVELLILDIMLPGIDGHEVLRRVRAERPALPVLMLTARDELESKVDTLRAGADDYLTKPFALEELSARVTALARRAESPADETQLTRIQAGDLILDLLNRRVWRGERPVDLSAREFSLLQYLARHPKEVLSRQQILSEVWDYSFDPGSNSVDVYVRYLRRKLDRPGEPSLIATVRGSGYRFDPSETPEDNS